MVPWSDWEKGTVTGTVTLIQNNRSRGVSLVWTASGLCVFAALVSLAADFGRVQMAKTELQGAVDAAARAGADDLDTSPSAARSAAIAVAALNSADGHSLAITSSQIDIGTW